ncbi:MAG TPA: ATP-binding protein, partial [Planctomycetota bacterium]|nr:ATP-binding protein [Planctomycetota bacterium]
PPTAPAAQELERLRREVDLPFLLKDFREAMGDIRGGAERIRDIVKNLREFTHLDPGEWKEADLGATLESAIRLCWNEIKYRAEIRRDFHDLPAAVCHPQQIEQVFVNLLVNAAQAMGNKGEIHLSIRREGDCAVIRIRDTGCGIAPEHRRKLFEPFFTTKPVGKGTGLGLHVVHKIIEAHHGRIEVESTVGVGTEFTVRLPFKWQGGSAASPTEAPSPRRRRKDVVVLVDDDEPTLRTLRRLLEGEPYRLLATARPEQALSWVSRGQVRLVISDQRMPEMIGTRLLEKVLERSPGTARMLLTAYPDNADVVASLGRAVEAVIPKPWDAEALKKAIRERLMTRRGN